MDLKVFAAEVGPEGPVTCVGGRTQWDVGGSVADGVREVRAPAGVVAHDPGEMIVRVGAGTTLAELASATVEGRQLVPIEAPEPDQATVGGVLACGRSGLRRLGRGPVRDCVLEITAVTATGEVVRAGAPLVKNVTGFDLCRLIVGSVGTLAFLAEAVLRCHPVPEVERWWVGSDADPFALYQQLYRPLSILWDGAQVWVGLAGRAVDVDDQARHLSGFRECEGPPPIPAGSRRSLPPAQLRALSRTGWLAEVGVGIVHGGSFSPATPSEEIVTLHRRIKERFDPAGRLNPGRTPL